MQQLLGEAMFRERAVEAAAFSLEDNLVGSPAFRDPESLEIEGDSNGRYSVAGTVGHRRGTARVFEPFLVLVQFGAEGFDTVYLSVNDEVIFDRR